MKHVGKWILMSLMMGVLMAVFIGVSYYFLFQLEASINAFIAILAGWIYFGGCLTGCILRNFFDDEEQDEE